MTGTTTTATTAATATFGAVGAAHTRVEGVAKVTGAARYAGEVPHPELAHGWLVLSTIARGRIRAVESAPVLAMPGVVAVLHHENAPRLNGDYTNAFGAPDPIAQIFQHDRVPFVGWPVALVVAETPEQAREAAESLVVVYDGEPHDVVFTAGLPGVYAPESAPPHGRVTWRPNSPRPPSSWTPSTALRRSTTAPWSRTRRSRAGTAAY